MRNPQTFFVNVKKVRGMKVEEETLALLKVKDGKNKFEHIFRKHKNM
jgi:hypothetical protein